ncbi:WBM0748 family T4SS-associated protein [Wolbachia pipientis]|uniref:WBM0748 family T4SS-associated protein n=1 Tax=Wolbachia pipientis TaxID=955 RepID=UPI0025A42BF3|nr:hypothetical protein [Wolbachia pipientis]MDM8335458.1 hypothetical protein [Wolbachia pipientis]
MSLKNKISELIEQQFSVQYHNNYLAYAIQKWAASEISDSITLCITGSGNCKVKYQDIANSFSITREEIDQGDIVSIENKIKSEAEKSGSEFSELISRVDQLLKEQSEKSIVQILNSSAEEMLKSFCGQFYYTAEKEGFPEHKTEGGSTIDLAAQTSKENMATNDGLLG